VTVIGELNAKEQRQAEEDEMATETMEAASNIYEYRGRTFHIMLKEESEGWWSDIAELGDEITDADGYTYRERHEWEGSGNFFPGSVGALMEATQAIRATVDDEDGVPF
jgi:hypothetical protein